jgi:hypothetical protein
MREHDAECRLLKKLLFVLVGIASVAVPRPILGSEPGTVGLVVLQLFSDQQPNKRGVYVVRQVLPASAAANAGIVAGDVIVQTDERPVAGLDTNEMKKRLGGEAGTSIKLSIVRAGGEFQKMTLVRKPFDPHRNPPTDSFSYVIPGDWEMDPRYPFPLPWSPGIAHQGFEDLSFAPGFDDLESPEYHSYLILWWLDGKTEFSAAQLQSEMTTYFQGLAKQRGQNNHFTPDLSRITAEYAGSSMGPTSFGGVQAASFIGLVTLYDRHGSLISLHSEVVASQCSPGHTAVFFEMSKEPRPAALWKQLDAVRDGFSCKR